MALRITYLQIIATFIYMTKYESLTEASEFHIKGNLSFTSHFPENCTRSDDMPGISCDLGDTDSEHATQIENILKLAGFNLTAVSIRNTAIRDIPVSVCRMKQLEDLYLGYNRLSTLRPIDCFTGMNQLENMNLAGNQIADLPDGIFKDLQNLQGLWLYNNNISVLREGIFENLTLLYYLDLNNNNISQAAGIRANHLNHLDMSHNQISDLPDGFFNNCQQLRWLFLSYNLITVLRDGIFDKLSELIDLDLSNNLIIDLPDKAFCYLRQLRYLDLSFNRISFLNVIGNCSNISPVRLFQDMLQLYNLTLSNNCLLDLQPGIVLGLENLIYLDLSNNRISELRAGTFANLPKLDQLFLKNNNISELTGICDDFQELKYLYLSSNNISYLRTNCFTECKKLVLLDLSDNRLSDISFDLLTHLEIMHFNLSHNALLSLNIDFDRSYSHNPRYTVAPKIQRMDFSHNEISTVDLLLILELANHCYGCHIDLSYNRIKYFTISDVFDAEPYYKENNLFDTARITLDLKGNNISHIVDIIYEYFGNHNAEWGALIKMNKQPILLIDSLVCDCRDYPVKKYNMLNDFSMDLTHVICSSPTKLRNVSLSTISIDDMVCDIEDDCPPKCNCIEQPSTNSIIINCTDAGRTDLPATLPTLNCLPGFKYYLVLSENQIRQLTFKDYINETTHLDISNCGVEEIDPRMWTALQTVSIVSLRNNLLTQFPKVPHGSFTGDQLDIQNSPISCDCKNKWLKSWLESIDKKIMNLKGIICNAPEWLKGKSVILLQEEDFCSDPPYTLKDYLLVTIPTIGGIFLLSVIVVLLLRIFRFKIFKYTKKHLFDRDECNAEDMDYDIFLSRSSKDEEFAQELIAFLEVKGYRVCYPDRDFMPGSIINDNIVKSIYKCKRVLCLMTKDFVQSNYCMEEFRIARLRDLEMGKKRTILLLKEPVQQFRDDEQVPNDVRDYIRRHTCIEEGNVDWEDQLMYAMPERRMLNEDETMFEAHGDLTDGKPTFEIPLQMERIGLID